MDPHLDAIELPAGGGNLLLGFFADARGDRYVAIQNPNHTNGELPTQGDGRMQATLRFGFAGATAVATDAILRLDVDRERPVRQPLDGDALAIDLAAGDMLLFKYDTGRPFAGFE